MPWSSRIDRIRNRINEKKFAEGLVTLTVEHNPDVLLLSMNREFRLLQLSRLAGLVMDRFEHLDGEFGMSQTRVKLFQFVFPRIECLLLRWYGRSCCRGFESCGCTLPETSRFL